METKGGLLSRLSERILGYVALAALVAGGIALYQAGPAGRAALWEAIWRTVAWFAIAAVLPWISQLFMRRLLEVGENWVGVVLIASLTLVNAVAGLLLIGGWPADGWAWLGALALLALAGTYNYFVCEYLAERSQ